MGARLDGSIVRAAAHLARGRGDAVREAVWSGGMWYATRTEFGNKKCPMIRCLDSISVASCT